MLKSFFWMCSGADPDLLSASPKSEQIKYAGIGGTVFFTVLMAFIASGYALYTVFDNIPVAIGFGFIWGLLIFNLDRFIVSSIKKREDKMDEFMQALPRILLAVIIAVVISKPLELKIFEKEIDRVLLEQKNEMTLANQEQVGLIYADAIAAKKSEMEALTLNITNKEAQVDTLYDTYIAEAEGREGTKLLGKGPVYAEKRAKHDAMLSELMTMKDEAKVAELTLEQELSQLELAESTHLAETQPIIDGFDGLMARINALGELPWMPSFFIFLLFLAIETSPVFAKLMTPAGVYDIRYADAEEAVATWAAQKKHQRLALLNADSALNKKVYASVQEEEESYHYKKQQARALLRFQADAFLEEQKGLVKG
ncbi:MAG: DUF4407 domain-containing protein [Bacteroidetes bacterium]|nr:DUF4407 domain-containing protein [Bacteroidota bacterium]MDA0973261.1 DUF4407 domain-containing protein [Bacteroidota bacterium]